LSNQAKVEADAKLIALEEKPQALPKVERLSPPLVLATGPGEGGFGKYLEELFNGYPEMHERSDKFVAIDSNREELKENALTNDDLIEKGMLESVNSAIAKLDVDSSVIEVHNFKASFATGVALYDTNNNRIVDYIKKPDGKSASPNEDNIQDIAETEDAGN